MSAQADQQAAALQQRLQSDPAFRAQVAQLTKVTTAFRQKLKDRTATQADFDQFKQAGVQLQQLTGVPISHKANEVGAPEGWMFDANGNLARDHGLRNDIATVAAIVGGGALAGAAGAAAAGGGAGTAAGTAGTTAGTTAATTAATTAPSTIATTAGMSPFTKALISAGVSLGTNVLNGYLQNRAVNKAAGQQTAAIDKASGILADTNRQNQQNLSPFLNLGTGAANALGSLVLGSHFTPVSGSAVLPSTPTTGGTGGPTPMPTSPAAPPGASLPDYAASGPSGGVASPAAQAQVQTQSGYRQNGPGKIAMRDPEDGSIGYVPESEVEHWKSQGAQVVQ